MSLLAFLCAWWALYERGMRYRERKQLRRVASRPYAAGSPE
jgi:hypothetical protein